MSEPLKGKPRFAVGDRVFSHYQMGWGVVERLGEVEPVQHQGEPTDDTDAWHLVRWDDGGTSIMNDGGTMGWDMARIMPPAIAKRYGYGDDPKG